MYTTNRLLSSNWDWDWDLGLGTLDLGPVGPGTWDLVNGTWEMGPGTWEMGNGNREYPQSQEMTVKSPVNVIMKMCI